MGLLKHTINCIVCGKESKTDQTGKKYCSNACKQKGFRKGVTSKKDVIVLRHSERKLRNSVKSLRLVNNSFRWRLSNMVSAGPMKGRICDECGMEDGHDTCAVFQDGKDEKVLCRDCFMGDRVEILEDCH